MKEIDFLPTWYRSGRRRQISYRAQYVGLAGIFVVMMVWNFIATHSLSKATAELAGAELKSAGAESTAQEFTKIKSEAAHLQEKARTIEEIDSKIDVANVLAEISFLVDKKIVLSKVEFVAEKFSGRQGGKPNSGSAVRVVGGDFSGKEVLPLGDVRFKVVINGVASDASDVAALICKLEDSPYFCQVIPSFLRNKEMKTPAKVTGENFQVSEFEISCELANYRQGGRYSATADKFAKEAQEGKVERQ
jgi:Tfp pilus assembly protein PilN